MNKISKQYDLEDRTLTFAQDVRLFVKTIRKTIGNVEDGKQLIKSSGSVGANYIEANEALSKKVNFANQDMPERGKREPILAKIN